MSGLIRRAGCLAGGVLLTGCGSASPVNFSSLEIPPDAWRVRGQYFEHTPPEPASAGQTDRIFFVDEGQGQPVVLLHGFPTSSYDWRLIWPDLLPGRRLIAPDFRGFGYSAKPDDDTYSIRNQADMIEDLILSRGVKSAQFIVHDYGASVGQELLARQMDGSGRVKISSIVFLNGAIFPDEHRPRFIQTMLLSPLGGLVNSFAGYSTYRDGLRKVLGKNEAVSDAELQAHWYLLNHPNDSRLVHRLIHFIPDAARDGERWVRALVENKLPVRVINGSLDPVSGRHVADRYRREIERRDRSADVIDLTGVGHYPQLEDPAAVSQAILNWGAGGYVR